jgi:hypothetical protein
VNSINVLRFTKYLGQRRELDVLAREGSDHKAIDTAQI